MSCLRCLYVETIDILKQEALHLHSQQICKDYHMATPGSFNLQMMRILFKHTIMHVQAARAVTSPEVGVPVTRVGYIQGGLPARMLHQGLVRPLHAPLPCPVIK